MKILIIDDSLITRDFIKKELSSIEGVEFIEATSGREGIDKTIKFLPDVVTMDVNMPDINGIDAASQIRSNENTSNIPIIFITGLRAEEVKKQAFEAGAVEFFVKPFPKGALKNYIEKLDKVDELLEGMNILSVDDSKITRDLITRILNSKGAKTLSAADGIEALEVMKNNPIDVIILDIVMPNMNGMDLCRHIRKDLNNQEIPIIVLASLNEQAVEIEAIEAGVDDFLAKPFSREELIARIKNYSRVVSLNKKLRIETEKRKKDEVELEQFRSNLQKLVEEKTSELFEAHERLKVLDKIKSDFLKRIFFELQNPLNDFCFIADMLIGENVNKKQHGEHIGIYEKSKKNLLNIIDSALVLTGIEANPDTFILEGNNLEGSLHGTIDEMQGFIKEKKIKIDLDDNCNYTVLGETILLHKVLKSILQIAITFSDKEKTLKISCGKTFKKAFIKIDTIGGTLSNEALNSFFDFSKNNITNKIIEDIGIAPLLIKSIMQLFKGNVTVENRQNTGVTFTLQFQQSKES
ncbi:MAG: hybrid sensor histidine kinase/response regulator [Nitrospinae bacterium]|nr:hybrid sensor histidine kinase/response regulator [Nitrospinota bacterium]